MKRKELRERGAAVRARLGLQQSALGEATGLDALLDEMVYAEVWSRAGLGLEDRMVCTLSAVTALGREREGSIWAEAALEIGLEAPEIVEVFVQCGLYAGFGVTQGALAIAKPIFEARDVVWPKPTDGNSDQSTPQLEEAARSFATELHGVRSTADYADPEDPSTRELYAIARRFGYGVVWRRPALSRRRRLLCALSCFTVLGLEAQLRKFAASALATELGELELREAIIQTAPYGGFPRALAALAFTESSTED